MGCEGPRKALRGSVAAHLVGEPPSFATAYGRTRLGSPVASCGALGSSEGFAGSDWQVLGDSTEWAWLVALTCAGAVLRVGPAGSQLATPARVGRNVAQVRGILAERIVVSTMLDPFLTLRALVAYSGIGLRKLYEYLTDPVHPLPHYRVGGKIVVRRSEFDGWITAYRRVGREDVAAIVDDVMGGLAR